jgi:ankyrin repeat protein
MYMNAFQTTLLTVLTFIAHTAFSVEIPPYNEQANKDALEALAWYKLTNAKNLNPLQDDKNLLSLSLTLPDIIARGVNPNLPLDDEGETLFLFVATFSKEGAMIKELIERGARIDIPHRVSHETALMRACSRGFHQVVEVLLKAEADPTRIDAVGSTARDWAKTTPFGTQEERENCLALLDAYPPQDH